MIIKRKDLLSVTTKIDDFIKRVESTAEEDLFTPRTFYYISEPMFDEMCELLKEHEAVEPVNVHWEWGFNGGKCPKCMNFVQRSYNYCPFCGREVKWNES